MAKIRTTKEFGDRARRALGAAAQARTPEIKQMFLAVARQYEFLATKSATEASAEIRSSG
jgi:hypothetical protein